MKLAALLALALLFSGCAAKRAYRTLYCNQLTPDGKHCAAWAPDTLGPVDWPLGPGMK